VQEARIALLEHHTSQMQVYVDRGVTFFGSFLALSAVFAQLSAEVNLNFATVTIVFIALGFLCGCVMFSLARFARYGMTVRAVTKAPLKVKKGGSQTVLGQLDTCIGKWAEKEIKREAKGKWSKKWTWKLWKVIFDIGNDQIKSLLVSALLWMGIVFLLVAYWILIR
jgi:hypothetical protein